MKTPRALLFAIVCGVLAAASLYLYIHGRESYWNDRFGNVSIIVAKSDIPKYQNIDKSNLAIREVPKAFAEPDALPAEKLDAVPLYMADVTIKAGSQITFSKIAIRGSERVSEAIPADERACTASVNDVSGVGGLIRPGDHVDILGAFRTLDEKTRQPHQAEVVTIFQNIRVLAVGKNYMFESLSAPSQKDKGLGGIAAAAGTSFSNVTVSMTPRQCMDLTVAQQVGVLTFTLRSYYNRQGGKTFPELRDQHSNPSSAIGIKGPMEISNKPKWLEIRGEQATMVP